MAPLPNRLRVPATRRFQRTLGQLVGRAAPTVATMWDRLDDYDEHSVAILTRRSSATLTAVQAASVRAALGYYKLLAGTRAPAVRVTNVAVVADMREPFISVWQALASHRPYEEAVAVGRLRIATVISNFAVSSARQTGDQFIDHAHVKVHGWERIPEPDSCDWCELVAGQTYTTADAADFGHDNCRCIAAPAF